MVPRCEKMNPQARYVDPAGMWSGVTNRRPISARIIVERGGFHFPTRLITGSKTLPFGRMTRPGRFRRDKKYLFDEGFIEHSTRNARSST